MAKRFTDTEIWEQDWYIDLPSKYKLFWNYIKDKCDECGVWRPNKSLLQKIIGEPINLDEFLTFVNIGDKRRIIVLPNSRWWLFDFFKFQYGDKFNPKSNVHKGVLKRLLSNDIHPSELSYIDWKNLQSVDIQTIKTIAYIKGTDRLSELYEYPINRVKDKEQEQDKDNSIKKELIEIENEEIEDLPFEEEIENSQPLKAILEMVVVEMYKVWVKNNPSYQKEKFKDYPALMQLAYKIAKSKGWMDASVISHNEKKVIESWENITKFIMKSDWYSTKQLSIISNQWQGLYGEMRKAKTVTTQPKKMVM